MGAIKIISLNTRPRTANACRQGNRPDIFLFSEHNDLGPLSAEPLLTR